MRLGYRLNIFVGYFLNFNQVTQKSLIQNESYQQNSNKTRNNDEHRKKQYYHFCLLSSFTNIIDLYKQARNMSSGPFGQIFCGMGRIPNGFIPFSQFINKFITFQELEYLNFLSLNCDHFLTATWLSYIEIQAISKEIPSPT